MISSDIMFKAESLRRSWNIDNISPLNILQAALGNIDNLTILWFPMTDELSGCCSKTDDDKIICINSKHSKGRQISHLPMNYIIYFLKMIKNHSFVMLIQKMKAKKMQMNLQNHYYFHLLHYMNLK